MSRSGGGGRCWLERVRTGPSCPRRLRATRRSDSTIRTSPDRSAAASASWSRSAHSRARYRGPRSIPPSTWRPISTRFTPRASTRRFRRAALCFNHRVGCRWRRRLTPSRRPSSLTVPCGGSSTGSVGDNQTPAPSRVAREPVFAVGRPPIRDLGPVRVPCGCRELRARGLRPHTRQVVQQLEVCVTRRLASRSTRKQRT